MRKATVEGPVRSGVLPSPAKVNRSLDWGSCGRNGEKGQRHRGKEMNIQTKRTRRETPGLRRGFRNGPQCESNHHIRVVRLHNQEQMMFPLGPPAENKLWPPWKMNRHGGEMDNHNLKWTFLIFLPKCTLAEIAFHHHKYIQNEIRCSWILDKHIPPPTQSSK